MTDLIRFNDLARIHEPLRADIERAISRTLNSGQFLRGPEVEAFESEWAAYCGQRFAVACNSGTDALTLASAALGLETASIQANTLPLTGIGLANAGIRVSVREVSSDGRCIEQRSDSVPVLLFGRLPSPAELDAPLFDAAHAHGWQPPPGATAAWSFYPTKTLGALGDGGIATTNDPDLAAHMRSLRGSDDQLHDRRQITSRMDAIQAAILRVKLNHLDDWLADRRRVADRYNSNLVGLGIGLEGPTLNHLHVVRVPNRDGLLHELKVNGIEGKIHWSQSLDTLGGPWAAEDQDYTNAQAWAAEVLSLPCYPFLTEGEIDRVSQVVSDHMLSHHSSTNG